MAGPGPATAVQRLGHADTPGIPRPPAPAVSEPLETGRNATAHRRLDSPGPCRPPGDGCRPGPASAARVA
ncbi:hypothetical protein KPATCC21470_3421 [Kitasatospora purpeofusca]